MTLRPTVLASIFALSLSGCIINVNASMDPLEHSQQVMQLDANGLNAMVANTGAGSLEIIGVHGLTNIILEADIYTYEEMEPDLSLTQKGNTAYLVAEFDSRFGSGNSPYIDLVIKVPAKMTLDIDDGSGSIKLSGMDANIKLEDGSGSIEIQGGRNLDIQDGSGSITLSNVQGNIQLEDGSGSIDISKVNGDVSITDGSGSMSVTDIQGKVTIEDGSGGIEVVNTKGLTILAAGSGSLSFKKIDGQINIE
ncbi:DUF4097 family beta strand repeat-containing protein [Shewanella violacea]|uniref:Lipoprotein, putative n=1 Tax=Shewanella violacea (strain JCM 10179 / CIP 106290 / LMG 19151 / DSS12) TaxID=637905 RepID=D4ZEC2_SHEVD|nr:DUF4097 family beta strand repeat-containing protein [Shewanella violacea]BAJ04183.1 lipoprotein, putative [Shewanella violacea DSS12]